MGVVKLISDKLSNVMSGMGTTIDPAVYAGYNFVQVAPVQVEAAYRTSWLMRKIVDVPPLDMTRAWRQWQAEDSDIEAIERLERRLQVKAKAQRALMLARLWGGSALLIGIKGTTDPSKPLALDSVRRGGLEYLHVVSRHQIAAGEEEKDPVSEWFGQPKHYRLTTDRSSIEIHPSRVIPFVGQRAPEGSQLGVADWFWGDPLYQSIQTALQNADTAQEGFASLIHEAKLDIIKIPELMANLESSEYENRVMSRLQSAQRGKSTWRALILDKEEEWEQKQISWSGIPDIITAYLQLVSGAADIPLTRLLGQSPKGLQSSGEGEERDYHSMIAARQHELLAPALDRLDEVLIRAALGDRPSDVYYEFAPLAHLSEKDAMEIEAKRAATIKTYADSGLIEDYALSEMAKNAIIESGQWPGSEAAFEEVTAQPDEDDLLTAEEREPTVNDAKPVPLYVQRKLLNADELIRWAKAQGFTTTLAADDMHVTVLYSRTAVDPIKMGEAWSGEAGGGITIKPGGPRAVEMLGESAAVLLFASSDLVWRHRGMVEAGASHDYDEYQPHITISYEVPEDIDLEAIKPFTGELRFGPELFEPLDLDWKEKVREK